MAKHERIVPGTAQMPRYVGGIWRDTPSPLGIEHYGRSAVNGYAGALKVGIDNADRLERIGYRVVKRGTGYCYVVRGDAR